MNTAFLKCRYVPHGFHFLVGYGGVFEGLEVPSGCRHGGGEWPATGRARSVVYCSKCSQDGILECVQIGLQALDVDEAAVIAASQFYLFGFAYGQHRQPPQVSFGEVGDDGECSHGGCYAEGMCGVVLDWAEADALYFEAVEEDGAGVALYGFHSRQMHFGVGLRCYAPNVFFYFCCVFHFFLFLHGV